MKLFGSTFAWYAFPLALIGIAGTSVVLGCILVRSYFVDNRCDGESESC